MKSPNRSWLKLLILSASLGSLFQGQQEKLAIRLKTIAAPTVNRKEPNGRMRFLEQKEIIKVLTKSNK